MTVRTVDLASSTDPTLAKYRARVAMQQPDEHGLPDVVRFTDASAVDLPAWCDLWGFDVLQHPGSADTTVGVRRPA